MVAGDTAVLSLAIDPTDRRFVYAGFEQDGVLASGNRGATWRPARRGLRAFTAADIAADPQQEGSLWIAVPTQSNYFRGVSYPGLFHTTDGGKNWSASGRGVDRRFFANRVVLDPARPGRLYAFSANYFHRSTDGGASWQEVAALFGLGVNLLVADPVSPDTLYAAGAYSFQNKLPTAVLKSVDGGDNWEDITGSFETEKAGELGRCTGLLVHPDRPATVFAACAAGFFRTRNAGRRWIQLHTTGRCGVAGSPFYDLVTGPVVIDSLDTATMFAFGGCDTDHQLIKTTDRGVTWWPTSLALNNRLLMLIADPHRPGTFYSTTLDGPVVTDDDGATWRSLAAGLGPFPPVIVLAADPHAPGRLYLALDRAGLFTLTR